MFHQIEYKWIILPGTTLSALKEEVLSHAEKFFECSREKMTVSSFSTFVNAGEFQAEITVTYNEEENDKKPSRNRNLVDYEPAPVTGGKTIYPPVTRY